MRMDVTDEWSVEQSPAPSVPAGLLAMQPPVFRPRDVDFWSNPAKELSRLAAAGAVAAPVHGYYVVVPHGRVGDGSWRPTIEGFALALAQRVADADRVALVGVSAARLHGALPRALATAVVAVGEQRRALKTEWGDIVFVARDVGVLDVQRADTDLTMGWVTTIEQTMLDMADRPTLGGIDPLAASDVLAALAPRAEWDVVADLARRQRRRAAYARARWVADGVIDADVPMPVVPSHRDRYADRLGLRPVARTDPARFGVTAQE